LKEEYQRHVVGPYRNEVISDVDVPKDRKFLIFGQGIKKNVKPVEHKLYEEG
jgi:hypothetical protein